MIARLGFKQQSIAVIFTRIKDPLTPFKANPNDPGIYSTLGRDLTSSTFTVPTLLSLVHKTPFIPIFVRIS